VTYADTDFFLALIKEKDWLKSKVEKLLEQHKGRLWTSMVTIAEMMLLAEGFRLDPERIVVDVAQLAEVRGVDIRLLLLAAHFMKEYGLRTFDSLHAAFCQGDEILSSDKVFERVGLSRIPLEG
jgi:predicted nucleic acid-binding protein